MFTRQQMIEIEALGVVQNLTTCYYSDFKRGTSFATDNALADIYEQATGKKVERNFNCKTCSYNFYKNCGALYFESKAFYETLAQKKEEEEQPKKEAKSPTKNKPIGRPKKTTKK